MAFKPAMASRLIGASLFVALFAGGLALAQVVDPCRYGCPKEGCGCGEGGPINKAAPAGFTQVKDEKVMGTDKKTGGEAAGDREKMQNIRDSAARQKEMAKKEKAEREKASK